MITDTTGYTTYKFTIFMGKVKQLDDETAKLYNPENIIQFAFNKPFQDATLQDIINGGTVNLEKLQRLSPHFVTIASTTDATLSQFL
jgi:hypothetical protein